MWFIVQGDLFLFICICLVFLSVSVGILSVRCFVNISLHIFSFFLQSSVCRNFLLHLQEVSYSLILLFVTMISEGVNFTWHSYHLHLQVFFFNLFLTLPFLRSYKIIFTQNFLFCIIR